MSRSIKENDPRGGNEQAIMPADWWKPRPNSGMRFNRREGKRFFKRNTHKIERQQGKRDAHQD